MRILWVEDQLVDNRSIHDRLARGGATIVLATDVEQALTLVSTANFDIAIVDLNIPLGPGESVVHFKDGPFNGEYVIREAVRVCPRVICLTNFWEDAKIRLESLNVTVLRKMIYLDELERHIYGTNA